MSRIEGVPRVCFDNLIVKDHANFQQTARFSGKVIFEQPVSFPLISANLSTDIITQKTGSAGIEFVPKLKVDCINERTLTSGVTIEGVKMSAGGICIPGT